MSFTSEIKSEIARTLPRTECCAVSEICCALLTSGGISFRGPGRYSVSLETADAAAAKHYYRILRDFFSFEGDISALRTSAFGGRTQYRLTIPSGDVNALLERLCLTDSTALFGIRSVPDESLFRYSCCRRSFLRSAFLMVGSASPPEKAHHVEFACPNEEFAIFVKNLLLFFEFHAKISVRKTRYVVYLKQKEVIADVLRLIGASSATLRYENAMIGKELANRVNRQMNCDDSNIDRTVRASARQLEDIRLIESEVGLDRLPPTLRAYAHSRLANPSLSLSALGETLDPPVTKSGIAARARRLASVADRLRSGEDTDLSWSDDDV